MAISSFPQQILDKYDVHEIRHASAILQENYPQELSELLSVLDEFWLHERYITEPGGRKSATAEALDSHFYRYDWVEKNFETQILVDGEPTDSPTHAIDCFKNKIGIEVEWNNKDPFFDRDLNNFRLLFDLKALDVGIIITRSSELQTIFNQLGKGHSYGASTTHLNKLLPKLHGGGSGGCPVLVFAIKPDAYVPE